MAVNIKDILSKNPNLNDRMVEENWAINYDKESDILVVGNKSPKFSENVYLNEKDGIMIRLSKEGQIHGLMIEDFKSAFLKNQQDKKILYRIFFIPDSVFMGRFLFVLIIAISIIPLAVTYLARKSYLIFSKYKNKKYSFISNDLIKYSFAN